VPVHPDVQGGAVGQGVEQVPKSANRHRRDGGVHRRVNNHGGHATYPHLAPASYNRVVATLASLFAYTTRQGWTPTSPAGGLERRRPRSDRATPARARAIPAAELLAFLDADHPLREKGW
jgi:site-specific recombinase XerD